MPNHLWETDFIYLKVISWAGSTCRPSSMTSRATIITWKLCTTMTAEDVTETLEWALKASDCESTQVAHQHGC